MGMADKGQLPKILSVRSQHGTPTVPIAVAFAGVMLGSFNDFSSILDMENVSFHSFKFIFVLMKPTCLMNLRATDFSF
jgi:hypothetical protein